MKSTPATFAPAPSVTGLSPTGTASPGPTPSRSSATRNSPGSGLPTTSIQPRQAFAHRRQQRASLWHRHAVSAGMGRIGVRHYQPGATRKVPQHRLQAPIGKPGVPRQDHIFRRGFISLQPACYRMTDRRTGPAHKHPRPRRPARHQLHGGNPGQHHPLRRHRQPAPRQPR